MKKLIIMLICAFALCTTSYAKAAESCIAIAYENGAIYATATAVYENGELYTDLKLPQNGGMVKAFMKDEIIEVAADKVSAAKAEATPAPTVAPTKAPAEEVQATAKPTAAPRPTYHPVYESEKDAVEAIAVVKSVGIVADDDENKYEIKAYYRGEDFSFVFDQEIAISASPAILPELSGESLLNLTKGDVIMITCHVSGGVKRVDLIARAADYDIITSGADVGENFEDMFSNGGVVAGRSDWKVLEYGKNPPSDGTCYAFGVIRDRSSDSLVLVNEAGLDDDAHYLDLSENVIVYTCDMENKTELSMGGASDIIRSSIPHSDKDDDDNIINWDEERTYVYALARVVDSTVTEVVVYKGYDE